MKKIFKISGKIGFIFVSVFVGVMLGLFLTQFDFNLSEKETENKQAVLGENIVKIEETQDVKSEPVEKIVLYGKVRHFSTSGSMKFYYADDIEREKLSNGDSPWFWAYMSYDDVDYVGTAEDNSIFKITGTKASDDCGYIDDATCLEAINVEKIEAVK